MKRSVVQQIEENGVVYGQVSSPTDVMKAQDFIHQRVSDLTHDFLNNHKDHEVIGFDYELGGGNSFQFTVKTPGRIYAKIGKSYDLLANTTVTIQPADPEFPRLDMVVAVLEENMDAAMALIPFVKLRTTEELNEGVTPYPPQNINAPREKHDRAVVQIKTGTPAEVPALPTLNSNEVPLYLITVAPTVTQIRDADVTDLRNIILTLRRINEFVAQNQLDLAALLKRLENVERLATQPIDLSHIFGQIRTLGDILADHERQLNAIRNLPEVRYERPKVALTHIDSGKIVAVGNVDNGVPVVDIDIGAFMDFTGASVPLVPDKFVDPALNARFAQSESNPSNVKLNTALTLNTVTQLAADGITTFVEKSAFFETIRSRPACAARNGQFIEIFGGLAADNSTPLGDWLTYDTINDTLTPRTPLSALPTADRPAMFSYGDGTHVLLICGKTGISNPQVFKLNAVTGAVTEIITTKPTGIQFIGDIIAAGKIFVVAVQGGNNGDADFWEFDTATNTFMEIGVSGNIPKVYQDHAAGCYLKNGVFLLLRFSPLSPILLQNSDNYSARTYYFSRQDSTWREYNIHNPTANNTSDPFNRAGTLTRFDMANVNGRPIVVGGNWTGTGGNALIWEFYDEKWRVFTGTHPTFQDFGFSSTLGAFTTQSAAPFGGGAIFTGQDIFNRGTGKIYASLRSGLIATTFKDEQAITIADGSTFVQFTIPVYELNWAASGYLMSLVGQFNSSNLKAEVSFDGENYHEVKPDEFLTVDDSANPGVRSIRITLYNFNTNSKPVLAKLTEVFDEDGEDLESRIVIRYDAPNTVKALYIDRFGNITLSPTIEPSNTTKALLHKVTPNGSNAPAVKNYINRRPARIKYVKNQSAGLTVDNELATPARYVDARAVKASDKHLYKIPDPTVNFDGIITVTDVTAGDDWIVELES